MKASHRGREGGGHPITHASLGRRIANWLYNRLASYMTGKQIDDLMSGFRAARSRHFNRFFYLLPNGFSYPATSTMAFFPGYPLLMCRFARDSAAETALLVWRWMGCAFL